MRAALIFLKLLRFLLLLLLTAAAAPPYPPPDSQQINLAGRATGTLFCLASLGDASAAAGCALARLPDIFRLQH